VPLDLCNVTNQARNLRKRTSAVLEHWGGYGLGLAFAWEMIRLASPLPSNAKGPLIAERALVFACEKPYVSTAIS